MPNKVKDLVKIVRIRWDAEKLGFEKITIKNEIFKAYLIASDNSKYYNSMVFGSIIKYVQGNPRECKIKEGQNRVIFIVNNIGSVEMATALLKGILNLKSLQMQ